MKGASKKLTREQLSAKLEASLLRIAQLEQYAFILAEELRLLRIKKYGAGAERLSDGQLALLELEPGVCGAEVAAEANVAPENKDAAANNSLASSLAKAPPKQPVRAPLPSHLPREERIVHVAAKECLCLQCGGQKKLIGYQTSERLAE